MKKYQLRVSLHEVSEDGSVSETKSLGINKIDFLTEDEADEVPIVMGEIFDDFVLDVNTSKEETTQGNKYEYDFFGYHAIHHGEVIDRASQLGLQSWHIYQQEYDGSYVKFWACRKLNN